MMVSLTGLVVLAAAGAGSASKIAYRSVLGDPGMRWGPAPAAPRGSLRRVPAATTQAAAAAAAATQGPRMQLFQYNLCSKAGPADFSVEPAPTDHFTVVRGEIIGEGTIQTHAGVTSDATCTALCLAQPWCLAWTRGGLLCMLKDNQLPQPLPTLPPVSGSRAAGTCGGTRWGSSCNASSTGAWKAKDHNISTLDQCAAMCHSCPSCNYASFSSISDQTGDCSWYAECELVQPPGEYESVMVRNASVPSSGVRNFGEGQVLPSPRYADCIVGGKQTVTEADNGLRVPPDGSVDAEWFAVEKEQLLAGRCAVPAPSDHGGGESYFWTLMSQNGNGPGALGSGDCISSCYYNGTYPPAVNASADRCPHDNVTGSRAALTFNKLPMNQAKVMHSWTDPSSLKGHFNFTYELQLPLDVAFADFPRNASLGVWEWWWDERMAKGFTRIYLRVSNLYPWICAYFGADQSKGVKGNEAYDGRGMMLEAPKTPDFLLRYTLNISQLGKHDSFYLLNAEACWDQVTRQPCQVKEHNYSLANTNTITHQQVLMQLNGGAGGCSASQQMGCPRFHIFRNGTRVHRNDTARYPYDAWHGYCGPQVCDEMIPGERTCDPYSNPNSQSIYMLRPHPEWEQYGLPATGADIFKGDPYLNIERHFEINVGALYAHIWFPCDMPPDQPKQIITMNLGPETHAGAEIEWTVSDFDVLVPDNRSSQSY